LRKQIRLKNLQEADGLRDAEVTRRITSKRIRNSGLGMDWVYLVETCGGLL